MKLFYKHTFDGPDVGADFTSRICGQKYLSFIINSYCIIFTVSTILSQASMCVFVFNNVEINGRYYHCTCLVVSGCFCHVSSYMTPPYPIKKRMRGDAGSRKCTLNSLTEINTYHMARWVDKRSKLAQHFQNVTYRNVMT